MRYLVVVLVVLLVGCGGGSEFDKDSKDAQEQTAATAEERATEAFVRQEADMARVAFQELRDEADLALKKIDELEAEIRTWKSFTSPLGQSDEGRALASDMTYIETYLELMGKERPDLDDVDASRKKLQRLRDLFDSQAKLDLPSLSDSARKQHSQDIAAERAQAEADTRSLRDDRASLEAHIRLGQSNPTPRMTLDEATQARMDEAWALEAEKRKADRQEEDRIRAEWQELYALDVAVARNSATSAQLQRREELYQAFRDYSANTDKFAFTLELTGGLAELERRELAFNRDFVVLFDPMVNWDGVTEKSWRQGLIGSWYSHRGRFLSFANSTPGRTRMFHIREAVRTSSFRDHSVMKGADLDDFLWRGMKILADYRQDLFVSKEQEEYYSLHGSSRNVRNRFSDGRAKHPHESSFPWHDFEG